MCVCVCVCVYVFFREGIKLISHMQYVIQGRFNEGFDMFSVISSSNKYSYAIPITLHKHIVDIDE